MDGAAQCAGYMGAIPEEWVAAFGGLSFYTGWSSVYSIISRYSIGPSLWTFDADAVLNDDGSGQRIQATPYMNFQYTNNFSTHLGDIEWSSQDTPGTDFTPADPVVSGRATYQNNTSFSMSGADHFKNF